MEPAVQEELALEGEAPDSKPGEDDQVEPNAGGEIGFNDFEPPDGTLKLGPNLNTYGRLDQIGEGETSPKPDVLSLEQLVQKILPAVVTIEVPNGNGSGFFIGKGLVATNYHVVRPLSSAKVKLRDGTKVSANVVKRAQRHDLAILELAEKQMEHETLPLGTVDDVRVGGEVIAVGSPRFLENTVTKGIVSAIRTSDAITYIQTDAPINAGNSGGPLINREGKVVGINCAGFGDKETLNWSIAVDHLRDFLNSNGPLSPLPIAGATEDKNFAKVSRLRSSPERWYSDKVRECSKDAERLDSLWRRYETECATWPKFEETRGRDWFVLWHYEDLVLWHPTSDCRSQFRDILALAKHVKKTMSYAESNASRQHVSADVRRFYRRRYKMDWSGWAI
jgi:hypothetical protein